MQTDIRKMVLPIYSDIQEEGIHLNIVVDEQETDVYTDIDAGEGLIEEVPEGEMAVDADAVLEAMEEEVEEEKDEEELSEEEETEGEQDTLIEEAEEVMEKTEEEPTGETEVLDVIWDDSSSKPEVSTPPPPPSMQ